MGLTQVYFIFQGSLCAHIHICVKIQVSQEKASFFLFSCTISLSTAFGSKRELRPASFIFARHPTTTATKKVSVYIVDSSPPAPPSKNLGVNSPHSPAFRPAPSPKIWLDFSSQPSAQLDFWFQPPGQPPSPLPPNSLLYPVSFPPPPLQFHNLTLNGVRGAGAGAGAEVVEENFKAPSAVKKKPIPPPLDFFFFFFFLRLGVAFVSSVPAPTPGTRSRSSRCCRTPRSGPGSRGRRVTRCLAGGPCQPRGPLILHQRAAHPGAPRPKKFKLGFYFKWGGRSEGTDGVLDKFKNHNNKERKKENRKWNEGD